MMAGNLNRENSGASEADYNDEFEYNPLLIDQQSGYPLTFDDLTSRKLEEVFG